MSDVPSVDFDELCGMLKSSTPPLILDVRPPGSKGDLTEMLSGLAKVRVMAMSELASRHTELPQGPMVVICNRGYNSDIATGILVNKGRQEVSSLIGGTAFIEKSLGTASLTAYITDKLHL